MKKDNKTLAKKRALLRLKKGKIGETIIKEMERIKERIKFYVGNHPSTNKSMDYYFYNSEFLLIPFNLASKLNSMGMYAPTINKAFELLYHEKKGV